MDNLFNSNTFLRYEEPAPVMVLAVAIALVLTVLAGLIAWDAVDGGVGQRNGAIGSRSSGRHD